MAAIGPVGEWHDEERDEKKKTSIKSKMGAMMHNARMDGQTPKRWIFAPQFFLQLTIEDPVPAGFGIGWNSTYMGLPFIVDGQTIHECVLESE